MLRIICIVVVRLVARDAGRVRVGQVVVAVRVATGTRYRRMRPRQREAGGGVVERPVAPVGGGVALVAGLREAGRNVIRIRGALEILQMTRDASRDCDVVIVVYVAVDTLARRHDVRAGQRKSCAGMIERCAGP